MLPSGNDAALEIAIFIGNYLLELQKPETKSEIKPQPLMTFISEMNKYAKFIHL